MSEAVLASAETEDRSVTVTPFSETDERPVDILSDHQIEGFTLRFGPLGRTRCNWCVLSCQAHSNSSALERASPTMGPDK